MSTLGEILHFLRGRLNDSVTPYRWSDRSLTDAIDAGIRDVVSLRPDANIQSEPVLLAKGSEQELPRNPDPSGNVPLRFTDIVQNYLWTQSDVHPFVEDVPRPLSPSIFVRDTLLEHIDGFTRQSAVRQTEEAMLQAMSPNYASGVAHDGIAHYIFDLRAPSRFRVYPGADINVVLIRYSAIPRLFSLRTEDASDAEKDMDFPLAGTWRSPVEHYALYQSYLKDDEASSASQSRSTTYYNVYRESLGAKTEADVIQSPLSEAQSTT